jgi:uncharacterized repeat protein (TIGR03806 family)
MALGRYALGLLLSAFLVLTGCGGGGHKDSPSTPPPSGSTPTPSPDPQPSQPPPTPTPSPTPSVSGLDQRPSNTSCVAPQRAAATLGVQRAFPKLFLRDPKTYLTWQPIVMVQAPHDRSRFFVGHQPGVIRMFENREDVATSSVVLDISANVESACGECGMLGMAFHPDFPKNPHVYVSYTSMTRTDKGPDTHLSVFTSNDGGATLDPSSERIILTVTKATEHHHGGNIIFGRDGYLYMSVGDGNEFGTDWAQHMESLRGKFIRIDVNGTTGSVPYRIPADNPFADKTAFCNVTGTNTQTDKCPEIYAWGFRNPWRWSFDRETGQIWEGDVGESSREEVNRVNRGGNYGWRCFEGTVRTTGLICNEPVNPLPPIAEYDHTTGRAVTGGYVYRGKAYPALVGQYVFGDFVSGQLWAIPNKQEPTLELTGTGFASGLSPSSFAEDLDGEIYLLNIHGSVFRITGASGDTGGGVAKQLSATGCVDPDNPTQPAAGLIPYKPSAPFWSDGAAKDRWMGLPDGTQITANKTTGDWDLPNGTVLMKNFRLNDKLIETRLFMRHPDGIWAGYTYEWNADQTDATLVEGGKQADVGNGQQWVYPSESQCMTCHNAAAGNSLGLETRQLATKMTYPNGRESHQLVTLNTIGVMQEPIENPEGQTPYPDPFDPSASLSDRARSYLHTNCSLCHRPSGPTDADMDLQYNKSLADTNTCNVVPGLGDLGIANAQLIAPGHPEQSVLLARMSVRDGVTQMPPIGSLKVDDQGVALIREWIASLSSCN